MTKYSPIMNMDEGADFLARRILLAERPFIAVIDGIHGAGKTYFARGVREILQGRKLGEVCKLHDLDYGHRREHHRKKDFDYFLIENIDASPIVVYHTIERHFQKKPDTEILIVNDISSLLEPPIITLEKMLAKWNFLIENPGYPSS